MAASWDPTQYLRFSNERLRPALDLLAQVPLAAAARVVDLGCGTGNVTSVLRERFPQAVVIGVDASEAMFRPFLDKLPPDLREAYRTAYAEALRPHYPRRTDGATLLPFYRQFILARR
jgi:trans-aconitate 2-methyltransferase